MYYDNGLEKSEKRTIDGEVYSMNILRFYRDLEYRHFVGFGIVLRHAGKNGKIIYGQPLYEQDRNRELLFDSVDEAYEEGTGYFNHFVESRTGTSASLAL